MVEAGKIPAGGSTYAFRAYAAFGKAVKDAFYGDPPPVLLKKCKGRAAVRRPAFFCGEIK